MKFKITCNSQIRNSIVKKFISSSLIVGFLLNSTFSSFASILSENGRYETFEGSNITINNILEENKIDTEVEGNSLANVLSYKTSDNFLWLDGTVDEDGYIEITADGQFKNFFINKEDISVKPSTTYTYFLEIAENTLVRDDGSSSNCIRMGGTHETSRPSYWKDYVWISGGITGKYKFTLTTKDSFEDVVTGDRGYVNWTTSGKLKMRYMIIEGNHMDKDLDYFEGVKSSFEKNIEDNGCYNMKILSSNKNLANINKIEEYDDSYGTLSKNADNVITYTGKSSSSKESVSNCKKTNLKVFLEEGKTYTFGFKSDGVLGSVQGTDTVEMFWLKDGKASDSFFNVSTNSKTVTVSKTGWYYARFGVNKGDSTHKFWDIFVIKDSLDNEYTPHQSNEAMALLNEPLRGVQGGIKDRIIKKNGQWVVERNLKQITFSDASGWELSLKDGTVSRFDYHIDNLKSMGTNFVDLNSFLSDKLLVKSFSDIYNGRCKGVSAYKQILVISLGGSGTISDLDNYLRNNPLTVVYPLENPIYEPLNIDLNFDLYLETTHLINNSNIPANMRVVIDRTMNRAVEAIELAKTNPTAVNISQARMWANLLKESAKKDELQNELNNIANIEDLELEKKIATANLDIYVKSENALSMSLSTNSVTFEGYNGTEDLEKLNAVDIIVSSSLPYDLNAYLEENLQNSDKSNIMSPSTINIKENSNTDYSQFINTTDKVVLKSDCEAINNKSHSIDLKLASDDAHKADVYKAVIKFEAVQK